MRTASAARRAFYVTRLAMLGLALTAVALLNLDDATYARGCRKRCRCSCEAPPCCAPWAPYQAAAGIDTEALPPGTVATKTFRSRLGSTFVMHVTRGREAEMELPPSPTETPRRRWTDDGETFGPNHDRRAAKISISEAPAEPFDDLNGLRATLMPDDEIAHVSGMGTGIDVGRVAKENRNVTVRARLYASSKERDNDFHCILGTDDSANGRFYINAEISGLPFPDESAYARLKAVRQHFKDYFGEDLPGDGYSVWREGIPVRVSGSLFFDEFHYQHGNQAGTGRYKAPTYWEIHPITKIEFEP